MSSPSATTRTAPADALRCRRRRECAEPRREICDGLRPVRAGIAVSGGGPERTVPHTPHHGRCVGSAQSEPDPILNDRAALVPLIDARVTIEQIAAQQGCSASTVRRAARRMGLPPLKAGPPAQRRLRFDRDALEAMIASGTSTIELEAADAIGAGRYERTETRINERNGRRQRTSAAQAGDIELKIPDTLSGVGTEHHQSSQWCHGLGGRAATAHPAGRGRRSRVGAGSSAEMTLPRSPDRLEMPPRDRRARTVHSSTTAMAPGTRNRPPHDGAGGNG